MHTFTTTQLVVFALLYLFLGLCFLNAVFDMVKAEKNHKNEVDKLKAQLDAERVEVLRLQRVTIQQRDEILGLTHGPF